MKDFEQEMDDTLSGLIEYAGAGGLSKLDDYADRATSLLREAVAAERVDELADRVMQEFFAGEYDAGADLVAIAIKQELEGS